MELVKNIKNKAARAGMTIDQVERAAGISERTIRRWDNHSPSIDKVFRVAKVLECRVDDLICFEPEGTTDEQYFRSVAGQ